MSKILVFAGSTRKDSFNKKIAKLAAAAAEKAGASVTLVDLADYSLPLYDGDLEKREGLPERARALKTLFKEHPAFIIASPEYNSSYSGVLKNAIDWVSRSEQNEAPMAAFTGKLALLLSASPGALGGMRGLMALRAMLSNIKVTVMAEQMTFSKANEIFTAEGALSDPKQAAQLEALVQKYVTFTAKLTQA